MQAVETTLCKAQLIAEHFGMTEKRHIGDAIKLARERRGYGLNQLADEAEVDRGNLSKTEAGKQGMREPALDRIAAALGMKKWHLYMLTEEADPNSVMDWWDMRERLEPGQRVAALRLFGGHQVDKLTGDEG